MSRPGFSDPSARGPRWLMMITLVLGCAPWRQELPPPELPLTRTPDAPYRASAPVAPDGEAVLRIPSIGRRVLDNGMSISVVSRTDLPFVSVSLVSRAAGEDAAGPDAGLAVLTGDMLLRGSGGPSGAHHGEAHVHRRLPVVGTSTSFTHVSLQVLSSAFPAAIELLANVVRRPRFDPSELELQRRAQLEELLDEALGIQGSMRRLSARIRYGDAHRLALLPSGEPARVTAYTRERVHRFYTAAYRPEHIALVVVGDVSFEDAVLQVERGFAEWKPPPAPLPERTAPLPVKRSAFAIHAIDQDGPQTHVLIASKGVERAARDHETCVLIGFILGGLFESRGNVALRHASGASYGAYFEVDSWRDGGELYFWSVVDHHAAGEAVRRMRSELMRLGTEPVTAAELRAAKARYLALVQDALATNAGTGSLLVEHFALGLGDDALAELESRIRAIDQDEVRRVAHRYFDVERTPVLATTDLARTHRQLRSVGRVIRYELER